MRNDGFRGPRILLIVAAILYTLLTLSYCVEWRRVPLAHLTMAPSVGMKAAHVVA